MPELRQLQVFLAVAQDMNFTRAAEALFMTQQAVSKSIRQLERELDVQLFERSTHAVRLTAAGNALLRDGPGVLALVDAVFELAQQVGRGAAGSIDIGVSPAIGRDERLAVVRALRFEALGLSVALRELRPERAAVALRDGEVELYFARGAPVSADVDSVQLRPTPARLYVSKDHRLASEIGPVRLRELDGERLLTWNVPGTPLSDLFLGMAAAENATVEPVLARTSGDGVSLSDLVDFGAVAIAPAGATSDPQIVELQLADNVKLPLVACFARAARTAAVDRIRSEMGLSDAHDC